MRRWLEFAWLELRQRCCRHRDLVLAWQGRFVFTRCVRCGLESEGFHEEKR
jgi:hypothetical protein